MILYLDATTNIPDVYIDYIMVKLKNGQEVSLNWDESDISRNENGFGARYKGVYFGEEYANGRLDELREMEITDIALYFESVGTYHFKIDEMVFDDDGQELSFQDPAIPATCSGMEELHAKTFSEQLQSAQSRVTKSQQESSTHNLDERVATLKDCAGYEAFYPDFTKLKNTANDSSLPGITADVWLKKLSALSDDDLRSYVGRYKPGLLDPSHVHDSFVGRSPLNQTDRNPER